MTAMMLIPFYNSLLDSLNVVQSEDGKLSLVVGNEERPLLIGGKRAAMPIEEVLRGGIDDGIVVFHPLSEKIFRGESEVLKKLKELVTLRLGTALTLTMAHVLDIAANPESHKKLPPEAIKKLRLLPDADDKLVKTFEKITETFAEHKEHRPFKLFLRKSGVIGDTTYSRVAKVDFPYIEQIDLEKTEQFGIKVRKRDPVALFNLMNLVVPGCAEPNTYSYGSNALTAPNFDALMRAYHKVAKQINEVSELFRDKNDDVNDLYIDLSWFEGMDDLDNMAVHVPSMAGNEGNVAVEDRAPGDDKEREKKAEPEREPESRRNEERRDPLRDERRDDREFSDSRERYRREREESRSRGRDRRDDEREPERSSLTDRYTGKADRAPFRDSSSYRDRDDSRYGSRRDGYSDRGGYHQRPRNGWRSEDRDDRGRGRDRDYHYRDERDDRDDRRSSRRDRDDRYDRDDRGRGRRDRRY